MAGARFALSAAIGGVAATNANLPGREVTRAVIERIARGERRQRHIRAPRSSAPDKREAAPASDAGSSTVRDPITREEANDA
jgi:hypothetical protein